MDYPYEPLSRKDKIECKRIMRAGNMRIVKWTQVVRAKNGLTRQSYPRKQFRMELFGAIEKRSPGQRIYIRGVMIPKSEADIIWAVKGVQNKVFMGYTRLVCRRAAVWASRTNGYPTFDDFQGEGCTALIDAIYGWHKAGTKFVTFAQHAIDNALIDAIQAANPLSQWTHKDRKLVGAKDETEKQFDHRATLEEVVQTMGLSDKDLRHLLRTFATLQFGQYSTDEDGSGIDDYTAAGKPLATMGCQKPDEVVIQCIRELVVELRRSGKNSFEWKVIQAAMENGRKDGWQSELSLASNLSRSAAGAVLRRIRVRLEELYSRKTGGARMMKLRKVA